MSELYFSERELGSEPRIVEEIGERFWGWMTVYVSRLVESGSFGEAFPDWCPDNDGGVFGTNVSTLALSLAAEIPNLVWPFQPEKLPATLAVLDLIEFCHRYVAKPVGDYYHSFYGRHHLRFDVAAGQSEYRQQINRLMARNGLAFELQENGQIVRLVSSLVREELQSVEFRTGDSYLDGMLETARQKYLSPDPVLRRESLEKLWDAWERLKTLDGPRDKRTSSTLMLDKVTTNRVLRGKLEIEARELNEIGNQLMIRHTEVDKEPIERDEHVDYLFQRMLAMILLILRTRDRIAWTLPF